MKYSILLGATLLFSSFASAQTTSELEEAKRLLMDAGKDNERVIKSTELTIFREKLSRGWTLKTWKNLKAEVYNKNLRLTQDETTKKWCGVSIQNKSDSNIFRIFDSNLLWDMHLIIQVKTKALKSLQVSLSGAKTNNKLTHTKYQLLKKGITRRDGIWTTVEVPFNRFRNINALNTVQGVSLQCNGEPEPNSSIDIKSIKLEYRGKDKSKFYGTVTVKDYDLPEEYEMVEKFWPDKADNIRISGPRFTRDSKPFFMNGVEGQVFMFPWQYKLMNYDIIHLTGQYFQWFARSKKVKTGIEYSFDPQTWIDLQYKELLSNGIAVYAQPVEGNNVAKRGNLKKFAPESQTNTTHFMGLRFDNETGLKLKHNFWKSVLDTTRKYPTTIYELYNELRYSDYNKVNLALFREKMQNKYVSIEAANKTWGTSFTSFDVVYPPRKSTSYSVRSAHIAPDPLSIPLLTDWGHFIEGYLANHAINLKRFVKKYDKNPNSQILLQSTSDLYQDYTGLIGVYPPYKRKYEDLFGMELCMTQYPQSEGTESLEELKLMLKAPFAWEMLRDLNQKTPVLAVESMPRPGVKEYSTKSCIVDLHGSWKFSPENDSINVKKGVESNSFDDTNWKTITVPGVWGNQGFPSCKIGWFRKDFIVPRERQGKKLYLIGAELADKAEVYLNGKWMRSTNKWKETFCIDIAGKVKYGEKNTLAIRIRNSHSVNGKIQGGIRKVIAISADKAFKRDPLTEGQFRNYQWSLAMHGISGTIMSYAYASDGRSYSLFSPSNISYEAVRAMPKIPLEINSVASIIYPKQRRVRDVMCVYPFETGRSRILPEGRSWFRADVTMDILNYFSAAYFEQFDIGVTCNERIVEGGLEGVKALFLLNSPRVMNGVPEKLENFVKNGGTLILDADSMTINDYTHNKIETPEWFGIKPGKKILEADELSTIRHRDNSYGIDIELNGAKAIVSNSAGEPVVTEHSYGKGKVYYFARNIKQPRLRSIVKNILVKNDITPSVALKGDGYTSDSYISARKMNSGDRTLWYLYNWGGGNKKITATAELPEGEYTVKDVVTGDVVHNNLSSNQELQLTLKSHEPLALLFEKNGTEPLELQKLSETHKEFISWWRKSPESEHKLLFCSTENEAVCKSRIITGVHMLEENGFQVETGGTYRGSNKIDIAGESTTFDLNKFSVIALPNPRMENTAKWREALKNYVMNGGSVYLSANQHEGPHNWWSNRRMRKLFEIFNVKAGKNVYDKKNFHFDYRFPTFSIDSELHPVLTGCKEFQSKGMAMLTLKDQKPLMFSNSSSTVANVPIMTAFEFGKGRVVIMGDSKWMLPQYLEKSDNAQLMLNIFNWLGRRPIKVMDKKELKKMIQTSFN